MKAEYSCQWRFWGHGTNRYKKKQEQCNLQVSQSKRVGRLVCFMVFNVPFNNISVISWRSVLLLKETGGLGENHRPVVSHWQTLVQYTPPWSWFEPTPSVVIDTDCIGNHKSNYHMITTTTAPKTKGTRKN